VYPEPSDVSRWAFAQSLVMVVSAASALTACGGGSGDVSTPAVSVTSLAAPVPTAVAAPPPTPIVSVSTGANSGSANVMCTNGNGGAPINGVCTITPPTVVSAVTQLRIAPESRSAIKLTWEAPTDTASYVIYRKPEAGATSFVQVAAFDSTIRSYIDAGLNSGVRYTYRLVRKIAAVESAPAQATQSPYSPPIVITQGGTYSGNWDNSGTGDRDAAIKIETSQPVIIENSYIRSPRYGIDSRAWNTTLTVRGVYGYAVNPNIAGQRKACFVNMEEFNSVTMENNWIEGYLCGLRAMNYEANTKANRSGQIIHVRFNQLRNVDGRESDGNGGYRFATNRAGQAFGLNSVNRGVADFAWNEIINLPFQSETEDVISTYMSGGTASNPIKIRFNFVQGAHHSNVAAQIGYSGVVINLGDCEVNNNPNIQACEHVHAFNNRVVSFSNKGIDIIGGRNMKAYNNRAISASAAPDGTIIESDSRSGLGYWNIYENPYWANNLMYDNYAFVVNKGNATGTWFGHGDISYSAATYYNNTVIGGERRFQPALVHATRADEEAEYAAWKVEVNNAGIALGPQRCSSAGGIKICQ
jgi:hypothetical protein